ncbi:MAG TPA: lysophospholipid acyltransferase family protein [Vicinamibacteria bacterium]|nr:lysophospholipid acyltransferase family protein [Vicinamibacteria bacterium]
MSGRRLLFLGVKAPLALALTALFSFAATLAAVLDRSGRTTREIGGAWSRTLLRLFGVEVSVSGAPNVPAGPAVYASNHASALDILVLFGYLPVDFRIVYKRVLSLLPLVGWSIWLSGHIPIDRKNPFRARRSMEKAAQRIRSGTNVVMFPEGTRSPDGTVRLFKRGSFSLAIEAGAPVVPVSLSGVKALVPAGLVSLRPGRVRVGIAPPVPSAGRPPTEVDAFAEEVRRIVIANCAAADGRADPA